MKDTGIIRHIDELGRVTLPSELRKSLFIDVKDPVQIYVENNRIIIEKEMQKDIFTGSSDDLISYHGKLVSKASIKEMASLIDLI